MTIEEHSKARLHGAKWALGLDVSATAEEVDAARLRAHTSITMRADRMSGAPCVGDSRLTVESIAHMDRETCRAEFPQVTDAQFAAVKAWLGTDFGRDTMGTIARVVSERDEAREQCASLSADLGGRERELAQADLTVQRLRADREVQDRQNAALRVELANSVTAKLKSEDRLHAQIRELMRTRDDANEAANAAEGKMMEAEAERDDARRAADVLRLDLAQAHKDHEEAHRLCQDMITARDKAQDERDEAQEKAKMFDYIDAARDNYLSDLTALRRENEIERATAQREISHLRNEHRTITADLRADLDEARRLHANAVEELARVKIPTITADQIELFIWRSGWDDELSATSAEVERFAKSLAQHLRGAP